MYSEKHAKHAIDFINNLKHTKSQWHGVPFDLLPWQDTIIRDVYGTIKKDGTRQYSTAYIEIPKKQGKSELGAAIALQGLAADGEWAAEVYGCAADKAQASLVFDVAVDMVDQSKVLKKRIKLIPSQKRMVYMPTNSFYQVLSAEAYSKHGLNVHMVVFDELHAQPNRELFDVMTKGSGDARSQPLFFIITTAGDDPDRVSIGWEIHKKAVDVLMGVRKDPTFYAQIYGIEPEEKRVWHGQKYTEFEKIDCLNDKKIWRLVNPSLGHTVQEYKVKDACVAAEGNYADERTLRWLRFNEWVKDKTTKWIPLTTWDASSNGMIIRENLQGMKCYGGLDLSSKIDITAFVLIFPPNEKSEKWQVLPTFWLPEDVVQEKKARDGVPYDEWIKQGFVLTTPGNVIDYAFIRKTISGMSSEGHTHCLKDEFDIMQIGFDPWNATQIALDLDDDGVEMVEVRQGFKTMSPAMRELEKLVISAMLEHGGNPVLRWMWGNIEVKQDENENIRPIKSKSTGRIDGIVALLNAIARAILMEDNTSVYDERGFIVI